MQTLEELGYSDRFGEVNKSKSQSLLLAVFSLVVEPAL